MRLFRQSTSLLRRELYSTPRIALDRSFSTQVYRKATTSHLLSQKTPSWQQYRKFSRTVKRTAAAQEGLRPEAYLESGVVQQSKNLVDVKKVLVIGSGGLSIGQAGEFDYSGEFCCTRARNLGVNLTRPNFTSHDPNKSSSLTLAALQDHKL